MTQQANKHRRPLQLEEGMKVYLKTDHLQRPPSLSSKLLAKWAGPYTVTQVISPVAAKLDLPPSVRLHPVVHVSNLKPAEGNTALAPAAVFEQGGAEEFEVEDILGSRVYRNREEFLVKWKGYPTSESTWEPKENLDNAPDVLSKYFDRLAAGAVPVQRGGSVRAKKRNR